jgi:hypothetical protein
LSSPSSGDPGKNRNPSQACNDKCGEIYAARYKRVSIPGRWEGKKGRKKNTGFFFLPGLKKGYFSILA